MEKYYPRIADAQLSSALERIGAVLISGPKWCGKTSTAKEQAASVLYMQDPDKAQSYLQMAELQPSRLLEGAAPRLLDEWQMAPSLWDAVRFAVDQRELTGQFILTGSSVPKDDVTMHTGTGRIARLNMRTMTLFESLESSGEVSLGALFEGANEVAGESRQSIESIAYIIARGGWPQAVVRGGDVALRLVGDYLDALVESDISRVDDIKRNPASARALMRSFARNTAQQASLVTIHDDVQGQGIAVSERTIADYTNALRRLFVLDECLAWSPRMRSRTAIRSSPTWHFADPSIAVAALQAKPSRLLDDLETMGFLFESLCMRDLRVYSSALGGSVFHFRDRNGFEVDAIVQLYDGSWAAVEVKLGGQSRIDKACEHLLQFEKRIDAEKMGKPAFMMVLTAGEFAYRRSDGVFVVPLGCLKT
ncbi:MAG: DUF4143 domain-containing protein [Eggerthellaceae bacterium]|nr:DUF4143 domain-containing protein [Eggerthellaceae bacterium]